MILIIDNYDSFTYNLVHYFEDLDAIVEVVRNDKILISNIRDMLDKKQISSIILSPGPSRPEQAGICLELVAEFYRSIPILGVCLGHQVIGQVFGSKIIKMHPMHGKVSQILHDGSRLFEGIKLKFNATRYHSLIIDSDRLATCLKVTAKTEEGIIMAVEHRDYPVFGVQFHPESIASECGHQMLQNFINITNIGSVNTAFPHKN